MNKLCNLSNICRFNFKANTIEYVFILSFTTLFGMIFGGENYIVGIIAVVLMMSSMARDLTASPLKNMLGQGCILTAMAIASFAVVTLPQPYSLIINFFVMFLLLYFHTFEYSIHLYMPYIISYLFLIFISPVKWEQLPVRVLAVLAGAVCIIAYQMVRGRKRAEHTVRSAFNSMIDDVINGSDKKDLRQEIYCLSNVIFGRKGSALNASRADLCMLNAGYGLSELSGQICLCDDKLIENVKHILMNIKDFVNEKSEGIAEIKNVSGDEYCRIFETLNYIRENILNMSNAENQNVCIKTKHSLYTRVKIALDISSFRFVYALRTALLLSLAAAAVLYLKLPYGKWLVFTLASVSMPYADDIVPKAKKRFAATLIGGAAVWTMFSLLPFAAARNGVKLFAGYLSAFFADYRFTFACASIGALGSALDGVYGWSSVGAVFGVRLLYICAGIAIVYAVNKLIFPYTKGKAAEQLCGRYIKIAGEMCKGDLKYNGDMQLYICLDVRLNLIEEKILTDAADDGSNKIEVLISEHRKNIRENRTNKNF